MKLLHLICHTVKDVYSLWDTINVVAVVDVSECNCDRYGSVSTETCAAISGQCECRRRFAGRDCSQCEVSLIILTAAYCC